jgi:hypothetical protein
MHSLYNLLNLNLVGFYSCAELLHYEETVALVLLNCVYYIPMSGDMSFLFVMENVLTSSCYKQLLVYEVN